jgi:hypothetical protein
MLRGIWREERGVRGYSMSRATPAETTKADIQAAERQQWFGDVVLVEPIL